MTLTKQSVLIQAISKKRSNVSKLYIPIFNVLCWSSHAYCEPSDDDHNCIYDWLCKRKLLQI